MILIFILLAIIGLRIGAHFAREKPEDKLAVEVVEVKQCPPHKWTHVEVKDTEGNTVKWKIVCLVCGPMQSQGKPSGGDYS